MHTDGVVGNVARLVVGLKPSEGTAVQRAKLRARYQGHVDAKKKEILKSLVEASNYKWRDAIIIGGSVGNAINFLWCDIFGTHESGSLLVADSVSSELVGFVRDTVQKIFDRKVEGAGYPCMGFRYMVDSGLQRALEGDGPVHAIVDGVGRKIFAEGTAEDVQNVINGYLPVIKQSLQDMYYGMVKLSQGENNRCFDIFNHVYWLTRDILMSNKPGCLQAAIVCRNELMVALDRDVLQKIRNRTLFGVGKNFNKYEMVVKKQIDEVKNLWNGCSTDAGKHLSKTAVDKSDHNHRLVEDAAREAEKEEEKIIKDEEDKLRSAAAASSAADAAQQNKKNEGKAEKAPAEKEESMTDLVNRLWDKKRAQDAAKKQEASGAKPGKDVAAERVQRPAPEEQAQDAAKHQEASGAKPKKDVAAERVQHPAPEEQAQDAAKKHEATHAPAKSEAHLARAKKESAAPTAGNTHQAAAPHEATHAPGKHAAHPAAAPHEVAHAPGKPAAHPAAAPHEATHAPTPPPRRNVKAAPVKKAPVKKTPQHRK